jgi:hypothetical protein
LPKPAGKAVRRNCGLIANQPTACIDHCSN